MARFTDLWSLRTQLARQNTATLHFRRLAQRFKLYTASFVVN